MAKALYMLALYEHAYLFSVSLNTHSQSFQKYPVATEEFETGFTYCMEAKQGSSKYVTVDGWMDGWLAGWTGA